MGKSELAWLENMILVFGWLYDEFYHILRMNIMVSDLDGWFADGGYKYGKHFLLKL